MSTPASAFTVTFVDGVTLDKWRRRWGERVPGAELHLTLVDDRLQVDAVRAGAASMGFVRDLAEPDRDGLHHIPLYRETPVVVVGQEHPVAAYDEIPFDDLRDELFLDDPDLSTRLKVETVAAGTGIVLLPLSVARVHHRKDVVTVPVLGAPESEVGLVWRRDSEDPLVDTFVGIVRGRTERSSRGAPPAPSRASGAGGGTGSRAGRPGRDGRRTGGNGKRRGRGHRR